MVVVKENRNAYFQFEIPKLSTYSVNSANDKPITLSVVKIFNVKYAWDQNVRLNVRRNSTVLLRKIRDANNAELSARSVVVAAGTNDCNVIMDMPVIECTAAISAIKPTRLLRTFCSIRYLMRFI